MFELNCKCQSIVKSTSFLFKLVLEVTNILTISVPAVTWTTILNILILFGIKQWFHTLVVWTIRLDKIDEIEFVRLKLLDVLKSEVKPLRIRSR